MKKFLVGVAALALMPLIVIAEASSAGAAWWSPTPSCGSTTFRKTNGVKYVCSFSDDFSGSSLNRNKWVAQQTGISGHSLGGDCWVDDPDNIKVSGGTLKLISRHEDAPLTCKSPFGDFTTEYTSGSVSTRGKFSQTYGRYEFRAKFPDATVTGSHSALWLYPYGQAYGSWPASGEIDVAEYYTKFPDRAIPYVHYNVDSANTSPVTNTSCKISDPWNFHTYVMEWTTKTIKISYDGSTCLEHTIDAASPLTGVAPFDKPFVVYLSQVLGSGSNAFSGQSTPLPLTTEIDWVRVWK
jgi:beta-glucanase (GH16 family)